MVEERRSLQEGRNRRHIEGGLKENERSLGGKVKDSEFNERQTAAKERNGRREKT